MALDKPQTTNNKGNPSFLAGKIEFASTLIDVLKNDSVKAGERMMKVRGLVTEKSTELYVEGRQKSYRSIIQHLENEIRQLEKARDRALKHGEANV